MDTEVRLDAPANATAPASQAPDGTSKDLPAARAGTTGNLDVCLKVLTGIQDQIRLADTKAVFVFGINTLMFGFVASGSAAIKRGLTGAAISPAAVIALVALVLFFVCAVGAVATLIVAVMSRFGPLAPKSRIFFGHIVRTYGKDYSKYVAEVRGMSDEEWLVEVGNQIVETSNIANTKHSAVRIAAIATLVGLAMWIVTVLSISLIP
jgi:hypothetical protein